MLLLVLSSFACAVFFSLSPNLLPAPYSIGEDLNLWIHLNTCGTVGYGTHMWWTKKQSFEIFVFVLRPFAQSSVCNSNICEWDTRAFPPYKSDTHYYCDALDPISWALGLAVTVVVVAAPTKVTSVTAIVGAAATTSIAHQFSLFIEQCRSCCCSGCGYCRFSLLFLSLFSFAFERIRLIAVLLLCRMVEALHEYFATAAEHQMVQDDSSPILSEIVCDVRDARALAHLTSHQRAEITKSLRLQFQLAIWIVWSISDNRVRWKN